MPEDKKEEEWKEIQKEVKEIDKKISSKFFNVFQVDIEIEKNFGGLKKMSEGEWKEFLEYAKTRTAMSEEKLREYFDFMTGDYKTSMKDLRADSEKKAEANRKFRTIYLQKKKCYMNLLNNIRQQKYTVFSEYLKAIKEWELKTKKYNEELGKLSSESGLDKLLYELDKSNNNELDKLLSELGKSNNKLDFVCKKCGKRRKYTELELSKEKHYICPDCKHNQFKTFIDDGEKD